MKFSFILAFFLWNQESLLRTVSASDEEQAQTVSIQNEDPGLEMLSNDLHQMSWYAKNTTMSNATNQVIDINKSQDSTSSTDHRSSPTRSSNGGCQLYMAESSIPNAGLGMYTAIPLKQGQMVQQPEIGLNHYDLEQNMKMNLLFSEEERAEWIKAIDNKEDSDDSCVLWAKQGECEANANYMLDSCPKSCAVKKAGLDLDKVMATQIDKSSECKGFALNGECDTNPGYMIPNCPYSYFIKKSGFDTKISNTPFLPTNYYWSSGSTRSGQEADSTSSIIPGLGALANSHLGLVNAGTTSVSVGSAGYHRSKDVGVGAFSDRFNLNYVATENIPAGMELFVNYGDGYFLNREEKMGPVPMPSDYIESESRLEEFWKDLDLNTSGAKNATAAYVKLLDSITVPKVKMVMPKTLEEAQSVRGTKAAMLSVPTAIKSQDWLENNGVCLDNIYPGQSKVPQAGRGAFASRKIKNGQLISPMPVMHMNKNTFRLFNNEQVIGTQLMLNYVFGHEKSSLALLPYSPIVNFVNNHVDKSKVNARIQWSTHKYHNKSWECKSVKYILGQDHDGLMLELVAITDIEEGDEIYIDYCAKWDEAWADHVQNWKAPPRSHEFTPV